MPHLTPIPDMPEEVATVIDVIGSQVRTEVLRRLSLAPMTAPELAEAIAVNRFSVLRHLGALEELGLVDADVPQGKRKGVTVRWSTNCDRVRALGGRWAAYATGE